MSGLSTFGAICKGSVLGMSNNLSHVVCLAYKVIYADVYFWVRKLGKNVSKVTPLCEGHLDFYKWLNICKRIQLRELRDNIREILCNNNCCYNIIYAFESKNM